MRKSLVLLCLLLAFAGWVEPGSAAAPAPFWDSPLVENDGEPVEIADQPLWDSVDQPLPDSGELESDVPVLGYEEVIVDHVPTLPGEIVEPEQATVTATGQTVSRGIIAKGTTYQTPYYVIRTGVPGPVIAIIGGVHGNETAGYTAASKIKDWQFGRGTIVVIPRANVQGIARDSRYTNSGQDLNRAFPQSSGSSPDGLLANEIWKVIRYAGPSWVVDLHEGYDYYSNPNSSSVGQSVIYHPNGYGYKMASLIVNEINRGIMESYRKFQLLKYPVRGSLARAAGDVLGKQAMIMETAMKQTLSTRVGFHTQMVNILLRELRMLPSQQPKPAPDPTSRTIEVVAPGTKYATPLYVIHSGQPGPVIMVVGGMRGLHYPGPVAADTLATAKIARGTLLVLPRANKAAIDAGRNYLPEGDLNRKFPVKRSEDPDGILARAIWYMLRRHNVQWLVDLEEASDYRSTTGTALGNVIVSHPGTTASSMATAIAQQLNGKISSSAQRFVTLQNPIWAGLVRSAGDLLGVNSFYVSTTRKDPLDRRVAYSVDAVNTLLGKLEMLPLGANTTDQVEQGTEYKAPTVVPSEVQHDLTAREVTAMRSDVPAGATVTGQ